MKFKNKRHERIIDIICSHDVETQEELTAYLRRDGFDVTQATVSRDIKELHLIKTAGKEKKYRYSLPDPGANLTAQTKYQGILRSSMVRVACAHTIVVVRCFSGMAQAACAAIDALNLDEIVGTIAGEDTIFIATESVDACVSLADHLSHYLVQD